MEASEKLFPRSKRLFSSGLNWILTFELICATFLTFLSGMNFCRLQFSFFFELQEVFLLEFFLISDMSTFSEEVASKQKFQKISWHSKLLTCFPSPAMPVELSSQALDAPSTSELALLASKPFSIWKGTRSWKKCCPKHLLAYSASSLHSRSFLFPLFSHQPSLPACLSASQLSPSTKKGLSPSVTGHWSRLDVT